MSTLIYTHRIPRAAHLKFLNMAAAAATMWEGTNGQPPALDLRLKLAELKVNGFVVLPGVFPIPLVDALRSAYLPLLEVGDYNARAVSSFLRS
jgi:hypothetical protein